MCLELSKEELQDSILSLESRLHSLQRNAEIQGVFDCKLTNVRSTLQKMRNELALVSNKLNNN